MLYNDAIIRTVLNWMTVNNLSNPTGDGIVWQFPIMRRKATFFSLGGQCNQVTNISSYRSQ